MSGLTQWTQLDLVGRSDAERDAVGLGGLRTLPYPDHPKISWDSADSVYTQLCANSKQKVQNLQKTPPVTQIKGIVKKFL